MYRINLPGLDKNHRINPHNSNTKGITWTAFSANLARDFSFLAISDSGSYIGNNSLASKDNARSVGDTFCDEVDELEDDE